MTSGLLVMAYGSPTSADDIEAYYTHPSRQATNRRAARRPDKALRGGRWNHGSRRAPLNR
ncbi:MAG: hypothetical protein M5U19_16765 [Microthrixaceae bacterium]|nr:hypothetical protein [Microthrixaceae bacterium]